MFSRNFSTAKEFFSNLLQNVPPKYLENVDTRFHFDISEEGGGQFTVAAKDGNLEVQEGLVGEPKCVVSAKNKNFIALLKGELNPMMAVFSGKVKISNTSEVLKYAKMFGMA